MKNINRNPAEESSHEAEQNHSTESMTNGNSFWSRLFSFILPGAEETSVKERLKDDSTVASALRDRYLYKKHCPYCFSYVSKRIYKEKKRQSSNIRSKNIPFHLEKVKVYVCPNPDCNKTLPSDFFHSNSSSLALVGGTESGKTTYITVFLELLLYQKSILNELGLFGSIINTEGFEQFENYREILIGQQEALPGTAITTEPIIVKLQSKHHSKVLYITLIDKPGEHFENLETLTSEYPNLHLADGIIFLMNPLDVKGITELIESEIPGRTPSPFRRNRVENFNIIQNLHQLYTITDRIKPTKSIPIPTVFCLSRADILEEVSNLYLPNDLDPSLIVKEDIIEEMQLVSSDLREFLEEVDSRLLNMIEKCFKNFQIFPVSALGKMPVYQSGGDQKIIGGIDPRGVLQPFLWILIKTKFI